jgi:hypothetical protein
MIAEPAFESSIFYGMEISSKNTQRYENGFLDGKHAKDKKGVEIPIYLGLQWGKFFQKLITKFKECKDNGITNFYSPKSKCKTCEILTPSCLIPNIKRSFFRSDNGDLFIFSRYQHWEGRVSTVYYSSNYIHRDKLCVPDCKFCWIEKIEYYKDGNLKFVYSLHSKHFASISALNCVVQTKNGQLNIEPIIKYNLTYEAALDCICEISDGNHHGFFRDFKVWEKKQQQIKKFDSKKNQRKFLKISNEFFCNEK